MRTGEVSVAERKVVDRARKALKAVIESRSFQKDDVLFRQGDRPRAVYFLRSGLVELERAGLESFGLCTARPGDVIGVTFAVSGRPYEMDGVVKRASKIDIVDRDEFLRFMTSSPGLHLEVVRMLSVDLGRCYEVLRTLGPKTRSRGSEEVTL